MFGFGKKKRKKGKKNKGTRKVTKSDDTIKASVWLHKQKEICNLDTFTFGDLYGLYELENTEAYVSKHIFRHIIKDMCIILKSDRKPYEPRKDSVNKKDVECLIHATYRLYVEHDIKPNGCFEALLKKHKILS